MLNLVSAKPQGTSPFVTAPDAFGLSGHASGCQLIDLSLSFEVSKITTPVRTVIILHHANIILTKAGGNY